MKQGEELMAMIVKELEPRGSKPEGYVWNSMDETSRVDVKITSDYKNVNISASDLIDDCDVDVSSTDAREIAASLIEFADWIEGANGKKEIQT